MNELLEKIQASAKKARDLAAEVEAGDRAFTDDEKKQITGYLDEAKGYKEQLQKRAADDELRKAIAELGGSLTDTSEQGQKNAAATVQKSLGAQFSESPIYKGWIKSFAPDGRISDSARVGNSPAVTVDSKALLTGLSDTSAGALIVNDRFPDIVPALRRPLGLRDVVSTGTISVDAVEWVSVNVETNSAAIVAEATSQSDGTKPESTFTFTKTTETVKTIAHWLAATKASLADAGQLRALIDNFLLDGLNQVLETQMATGNGGANFTGIFNISGIQTQAFTTDLIQTYRRARTLVRTVGRDVPNAYLMNPVDWQNLDLLKDNEARYYYGGPGAIGTPHLWGLPVIENEAITAGTAFVGNFKQLLLLDREQASIQVSDSHADFFIKNLVAFLCELRALFLCRMPKSIVKIALA